MQNCEALCQNAIQCFVICGHVAGHRVIVQLQVIISGTKRNTIVLKSFIKISSLLRTWYMVCTLSSRAAVAVCPPSRARSTANLPSYVFMYDDATAIQCQ